MYRAFAMLGGGRCVVLLVRHADQLQSSWQTLDRQARNKALEEQLEHMRQELGNPIFVVVLFRAHLSQFPFISLHPVVLSVSAY